MRGARALPEAVACPDFDGGSVLDSLPSLVGCVRFTLGTPASMGEQMRGPMHATPLWGGRPAVGDAKERASVRVPTTARIAGPAAPGLLCEEKGNGKPQHFKKVIARSCESS